jgi:hypothetical protein
MRESRLYGSVRGVAGGCYPYRDRPFFVFPDRAGNRYRYTKKPKNAQQPMKNTERTQTNGGIGRAQMGV